MPSRFKNTGLLYLFLTCLLTQAFLFSALMLVYGWKMQIEKLANFGAILFLILFTLRILLYDYITFDRNKIKI